MYKNIPFAHGHYWGLIETHNQELPEEKKKDIISTDFSTKKIIGFRVKYL